MMPKVLLIEDDPALQTLLFDIVSRSGYDVSVAMLDDYLFMVQEIQPTLLLLGCDGRGTFEPGWQIAASLHRSFPDLPIVMLSTNPAVVAEVGQTTRGRLFRAGVRKPFLMDDLLQTLARCCP